MEKMVLVCCGGLCYCQMAVIDEGLWRMQWRAWMRKAAYGNGGPFDFYRWEKNQSVSKGLAYGELSKKISPEMYEMLLNVVERLTFTVSAEVDDLGRWSCAAVSSPGFACRTKMGPKAYCATSSQHVAQHDECRKYQGRDVAASEWWCSDLISPQASVPYWREEQCALVLLFSLGADSFATTDFSRSRTTAFIFECAFRRVCWMVYTSIVFLSSSYFMMNVLRPQLSSGTRRAAFT